MGEPARLSAETFSETFYDCASSTESGTLLLDDMHHTSALQYSAQELCTETENLVESALAPELSSSNLTPPISGAHGL
jgi:hypothetical protein